MPDFSRMALLVGEEGVRRLAQKRVAVFGLGGVGGQLCEALARAGIGALDVFDGDVVAESNLNRQIVALHSTLGQNKAQVMAARIADINPACRVRAFPVYYTPKNADTWPFADYHAVADAVDMVSAKLEIIARAKAAGVFVVSSMGTGNKLHPEAFRLMDIADSRVCPLARVMRKELKNRGIAGVPVVCSCEEPRAPHVQDAEECGDCMTQAGAKEGAGFAREDAQIASAAGDAGFAFAGEGPGDSDVATGPAGRRRSVPGSISFVPPAAGLVLAGAVVRHLLGLE